MGQWTGADVEEEDSGVFGAVEGTEAGANAAIEVQFGEALADETGDAIDPGVENAVFKA